MTSPPVRQRAPRPTRVDASAVPTITGVRSWGAVLIALLLSAVGALIDASTSKTIGWGFGVGFVLGVGLAAVAVRRGSLFTALVQPPLVMVVVVFLAFRLMTTERMTITLIKVVDTFPTMLTGTAVAVVLCVIRIFAQPLREQRAEPRPEHTHV